MNFELPLDIKSVLYFCIFWNWNWSKVVISLFSPLAISNIKISEII